MIKITNEIDGKLYELIPGTFACEGCDFYENNPDCISENEFDGHIICLMLGGIWKKVQNEKTN
jgi:hypothetical protein